MCKWTSTDYLPEPYKVYLVLNSNGQVEMGMYRHCSRTSHQYDWFTIGTTSDKNVKDLEWYDFCVCGSNIIAYCELPSISDIAA